MTNSLPWAAALFVELSQPGLDLTGWPADAPWPKLHGEGERAFRLPTLERANAETREPRNVLAGQHGVVCRLWFGR